MLIQGLKRRLRCILYPIEGQTEQRYCFFLCRLSLSSVVYVSTVGHVFFYRYLWSVEDDARFGHKEHRPPSRERGKIISSISSSLHVYENMNFQFCI